jgi:hypothetical protein
LQFPHVVPLDLRVLLSSDSLDVVLRPRIEVELLIDLTFYRASSGEQSKTKNPGR